MEVCLLYTRLSGAEEWSFTMRIALSFFLISCIFFSFCFAAFAEGEDYDTLADWNVRIAVPEGASAVLQGSEYYLYARKEGSIPYVMLKTYRADDAVAFLGEFTAFMQTEYPDLKITSDVHSVTFGEKDCFETDFSYQVSGYDVRDRRVVIVADGIAYLFTSKEIDELGMTIGTMLNDVVANCQFVSDDGAEQDMGLSAGYLYCDANGTPRYWLDFTRIIEDNLVLHCWFRSGEQAFNENCYVLDLSSAEITENGLKIRRILSLQGEDRTDRLGNLTLQFYLDGAVMLAERNAETAAETADDQIPAGNYIMVPVGVSAGPGEKQTHIRPLGDGPYQPEELAMWARFYCYRNTGSFLPEGEVTSHPDGRYTIKLYETADDDGDVNTCRVSVSYTVDTYGEGQDDMTGEPVSLMR